MISAKVPCSNHPEEATLPLRWLCQLPYADAVHAYGTSTGRPDKITLHLDTDYVVDWTYKSGANGSATSLLSTYANGSDAKYNYDYVANGNITRIWRGDSTFENADEKFSYEYDSMNQLVRENLYYGENNSANSTYTYAYDSYGNMLGKYRYAYTTGSIANKLIPTIRGGSFNV